MATLRDDLRTLSRGWRWGHRPLVPRTAEPWTPPREPREFRTDWARTPAAEAAREGIQRLLLKPLVWTETEPAVSGLDHLDGLAGPVIFASNHASHLDAPLVVCSLPPAWRRRTVVGAAADYFFDVWWRAAATALVFNAIPVERTGGRRLSVTARRLLREGWSLLMFPEGTRSPDGWGQRFRHGATRLCLEMGIPAVPVAIRGSYASMPRGRGWPRPGRFPISVRFGPPVWPAPDEAVPAFTGRLYKGVSRLLDEDRATWWEAAHRAARGESPNPRGPTGPRWRKVWESTRSLPRPGPSPVWRGRR